MKDESPRAARRLMRWSLAPWERPAVLGDLQEELRDISDVSGERSAQRWYWRQVAWSVWPNLLRRFRGDERRRDQFWHGVMRIASGAIWTLMPSWRSPGTYAWLLGAPWFLLGAIAVCRSVFSPRVRMPAAQFRATALATGGAAACLLAIGLASGAKALTHPGGLWAAAATLFMIQLWPWWPHDRAPQDVLVHAKTESPRDPGLHWRSACPTCRSG